MLQRLEEVNVGGDGFLEILHRLKLSRSSTFNEIAAAGACHASLSWQVIEFVPSTHVENGQCNAALLGRFLQEIMFIINAICFLHAQRC
jgi:hypothetical protein